MISVEEYLRTPYRPDCDYLDGEVMERNLGEFDHSRTQREILFYLASHYSHLRERILPEQRVQVKTTRFRIPDVCILSENAPREKIITTRPVLCVEILSSDDRLNDVLNGRIEDYFQMGVPICWIIDPIRREGWVAAAGKLARAADSILRASDMEMPIAEVLESIP